MKIRQCLLELLRKQSVTDGRTDNVKTVYPLQTKFAGGITSCQTHKFVCLTASFLATGGFVKLFHKFHDFFMVIQVFKFHDFSMHVNFFRDFPGLP